MARRLSFSSSDVRPTPWNSVDSSILTRNLFRKSQLPSDDGSDEDLLEKLNDRGRPVLEWQYMLDEHDDYDQI